MTALELKKNFFILSYNLHFNFDFDTQLQVLIISKVTIPYSYTHIFSKGKDENSQEVVDIHIYCR